MMKKNRQIIFHFVIQLELILMGRLQLTNEYLF
nr:MAG TPA: hypothetical protein [Caudoviricetes sp.]